jgi:hypothetical protein
MIGVSSIGVSLLAGFRIEAFAQETHFIHKDIPFTLPEGWGTQDMSTRKHLQVSI